MLPWIFVHWHSFYKTLYFLYKNISDHKEVTWIHEHVKEGMNVIDVGANIGFYTILLSHIVGEKGHVYSFEPEKINFSLLRKNTRKLKNVSSYNVAVGNKQGIIKMYVSHNLNVDHRTYKTPEKRQVYNVDCVTLDSFFKGKSNIHFIKIDIQGGDFFAIQGASKMLKKQKNISIIGEYWPYGLYIAGVEPFEYLDLLKKLGFIIQLNLPASTELLKKKKLFYTNYIAIK